METRIPEKPIFTPEDFHRYLASTRRLAPERLSVPPGLVVTFHRNMFDAARRRIRGRILDWYYSRRLAVGTLRGVGIAVLHAYMGSSPSAMMLEEMIASGARHVIEVGTCGGLGHLVKAGDLVLVDKAHVDEGTSRHYFKDPRRFLASGRLVERIERTLRDNRTRYKVGGVWTTDAPYRETLSKLEGFRRRGAVGVNMETSALYAIGEYRGVDVASLQVVSDLIGEDLWKPSFHEKAVAEKSELASRMAVEALAGLHS